MKNLKINDRQVGEVVILDLEGNLRLGEGNVVLHKAIRRLVDEGQKRVLLNLAQVSHIDSSGLGELVAGHVALSRSGGVLKLLHLTGRVSELMTMTKLLTVFESYDNEADALGSFQASGAKPAAPSPTMAESATA